MRNILCYIILIIIVGCSHEQSHNELLTKAEQIVFTQPDSVVGMLSPSWNDTSMSEADRALFGLLYTEALHRSGLYIGSDSLIKASREYFERHGDDKHLARALLHYGIILYQQQKTREGILSMKQAEQMAGGLHEPAFDWYLYSVLGDVSDNVGDYMLTLRYYKQALKSAQQVDNKQWAVQTLNNIAMTFDVLGEKDSLKYYLEQAKPLADNTEGDVRANYLVNNASHLMKSGKMDEAKRLLNKSMQMSPTDRGAKLLADIYVQEGDTASAMMQWYKLTVSLSPDIAIQSYHLLIEHLNRWGDKENAAEYSQRLNEVYRSLYEHKDAAGIVDMMTQYDEQTKERKQYRTVIALLAAIIFLMIISALSVWYGRHRIDKLNARFAESQQQYNLTRSELTQMRRQKERELRENSMQMKETVSRLHASANKGQPVADEDANELAQLSYAQNPKLRELLSSLNSKEQMVCLLTIHNFLPTEIATLTISTPQAITNTRVRLLKKLFGETGGAKDFDNAIKQVH
ncbi:MAG: hypothetical protein IKT03_01535 [Muribaculaceae bacterium]|nr:hypothetical protein [Muribaculaceae bacterium]